MKEEEKLILVRNLFQEFNHKIIDLINNKKIDIDHVFSAILSSYFAYVDQTNFCPEKIFNECNEQRKLIMKNFKYQDDSSN